MTQAYSATGAAWQRGPGRVYDRLATSLIAESPVSLEGRTVLDLGAGTGAATRAIQAAGGTPIAADLAIGMLQAIAPARPASAVADASALPFPDHSLDGVIAAFSLNHVGDPRQAMREAARVARPGSPLLVSAYAADDHHPVKDAVNAAAAELGWRADAWVDELRTTIMPVLATVENAERIVADAGIVTAEVRRVDVAFPDLVADDLVAWRMGMAQLAPFVAALTSAQRDGLRARAAELLGAAAPLVRRCVVIAAVV
ncbi:MAG: class I SAM-dependent methyltransferase [Microthrixaceae bacterium]